jgi:hypothetical protein
MPRFSPLRPRSIRTSNGFGHMTATCMLMAVAAAGSFGCAKNHYYVEPNGQVTTVSRDPFFGIRKQSPETAQVVTFPTEVQGAKVIATTPAPGVQSAQIGVVNPAIPEAVVVQPPAAQGMVNEPPLLDGTAGANGTQISGGIRSSTAGTPKVAEGLLD